MRCGLLVAYLIFALCVLGAWQQQSGVPIMGSTGPGGASFVVGTYQSCNGSSATSCTITISIPAGQTIIATSWDGGSGNTFSGGDSASETFTTVTNSSISQQGFAYKISTGGVTTVTCTWSASTTFVCAAVGVTGISAYDSGGYLHGTAGGGHTFSYGPTSTLANANSILFGATGNAGFCPITPVATGWTTAYDNVNNGCGPDISMQYMVVSSTTAVTWSGTDTNNTNGGIVVPFH